MSCAKGGEGVTGCKDRLGEFNCGFPRRSPMCAGNLEHLLCRDAGSLGCGRICRNIHCHRRPLYAGGPTPGPLGFCGPCCN
eukprot:scaffold756_cov158-Amphora_coffeaeformis.AAC.1